MADLEQLEEWAGPLLEKLQPGERRALARRIGVAVRRSQQSRIAAQQNPDGTRFAPRKPQRMRDRAGEIKRGAMFKRIRQAKHLRIQVDQSGASIGFFGRVARIARVHQEGLSDRPSRNGQPVRYERRELLGFTASDRELIRDLLLVHLTR